MEASKKSGDQKTEIAQAVLTVLMFLSVVFTVFFVGINHPFAPLFAFGPTVTALVIYVWKGRRRMKACTALQEGSVK